MKVELISGLFFSPSDLYTNLEDPDSREEYKKLIKARHGYSDLEADEIVDQLRKKEHWEEKGDDVLVVVTNENHERAFQVGFLLGYDLERFQIVFTDSITKIMGEEEIAFIEKSEISPEAGIRVELLDEDWQETVQEGKLVGYEKTEDRNRDQPIGFYIVEVNDEVRKIEDWSVFTKGGFRFSLIPSEGETGSSTSS